MSRPKIHKCSYCKGMNDARYKGHCPLCPKDKPKPMQEKVQTNILPTASELSTNSDKLDDARLNAFMTSLAEKLRIASNTGRVYHLTAREINLEKRIVTRLIKGLNDKGIKVEENIVNHANQFGDCKETNYILSW